jgi:N-acylglucosamine 2-epimerase
MTPASADESAPAALARQFRSQLFRQVLPFWETHSPDAECGGYYTCLDRVGEAYDTDKFVWLQARQAWMFAHLCLVEEDRPAWRELACLGADFLLRCARDDRGRLYYALTRDGKPLMQPFSIFSEGFGAMSFAACAKLTGEDRYREAAEACLEQFLARRSAPKGPWNKSVPGGGPALEALSIRMMLLNMLLEMQWMLPEAKFEQLGAECLADVTRRFLDADRNVLFENVAPDGTHADTPAGRTINPGHGLEVLWMALEMAGRLGRTDAIEPCLGAILPTLDLGWDRPWGGLLYRIDARNKPLYEICWDQKMWWPHAEALIVLAMAWRLTGEAAYLQWLQRMWGYVADHFLDVERGGEWFGYCNRRGDRLLDCKGNRWKGCYHVPRALLFAARELEKVL